MANHDFGKDPFIVVMFNVVCCRSSHNNEDENILIDNNDSHDRPLDSQAAQTLEGNLGSNETKQPSLGVADDWWLACKAVLISFGVSFVYKLLSEWVSSLKSAL